MRFGVRDSRLIKKIIAEHAESAEKDKNDKKDGFLLLRLLRQAQYEFAQDKFRRNDNIKSSAQRAAAFRPHSI